MKILSITVNSKSISKILSDIRNEFGEKSAPSKPHITIRGPYKEISKTIINQASEITLDKGFQITLNGTGCFQAGDLFYVYISVKSDFIRPVWKKPDYPISKGFYNPHLTIYRGNDIAIANKITERYSGFTETVFSSDIAVCLDSIGQSEFDF